MRISLARLLLTAVLTALLTVPAPAFQDGTEAPPLQNLLSSQEWNDYQRKARYKERMKVFRLAFQRWEDLLAGQARSRRHDAIRDTLAALRHLSRYAAEEPTLKDSPKDRRARKTKKLEITLRRLIAYVADIQFQFPLEVRDDFLKTQQELEALRKVLLAGIFGHSLRPEETDDGPAASPPSPAALGTAASATPAPQAAGLGFSNAPRGANAAAVQRRRRSGVRGDQFTEEELDRLRMNQGLKQRVDVFLDIAESRLIELGQRLEKSAYQPEASDEEDAKRIKDNRKRDEKRREAESEGVEEAENPLLFYTPAQLIQAYERALDGITVNVDDRFKNHTAAEKDIRKVMKKLSKKAPDYLKQIEAFKKSAVEIQDEPLYIELLEAEEITQVTIKGSNHFLKGSEE